MKEILHFLYKPTTENTEKIFNKEGFKKTQTNCILMIILLIFEMFSIVVFSWVKDLLVITISLFFFLLINLSIPWIFWIFTRILWVKKSFQDMLLIVNIIFFFYIIFFVAIILISVMIPNEDISTTVKGIFGTTYLIWTFFLFITLLNKYLEKWWKTLIFIILNIIIAIIWVTILNNIATNTLDWYSKNARDTRRIMGLTPIAVEVKIYYFDNWKLPESLDDLDGYYKTEDSLEWQEINWCKFTYLYEKISEKSFSISACMESEEWKEKAKNDNWIYENRYEMITEL